MKRLAALLALTLMTSACSSMHKAEPLAVSGPAGPDTCGAAALQAAVGQPASILPTNLTSLRIVDVSEPAPGVDLPARVTVINDLQAQKVREIRCG
jgi:hypothetical protein